jgi:hypothetical protein
MKPKPKMYLLTGLPGSGKTYRRLNDPDLKTLPFIDIADMYRQQPGIGPTEAHLKFVYGILDLSDNYDKFIAELVGTERQMETMQFFLDGIVEIEEIFIDTPREVCVKRVEEALKKEPDSPYHISRKFILENMEEDWRA